MVAKLKILIIEDNPDDADLLQRELKKSGLDFIAEIVQTRVGYQQALDHFNPAIILSDYSLPSFDAISAFKMKQAQSPNVPFIIVSGIIGEENVVDLIKDGVTDYVYKGKLFTISNKINRALNDTAIRNDKKNTDEKLRKQTVELINANEELVFQNQTKEKQAADLVILSNNLKAQQSQLQKANKMLTQQEEQVRLVNDALSLLNLELEERVDSRTKALTASEYKFRNMMETIPQIAWTNNDKGEVIYHNQRWYDYTGLNESQMQFANLSSIIHPEDLQNSLTQFRSIRKNNKGGEFQLRGKRADGLYRWHLIRLMPITDQGEFMPIWVGTATDIQELRILQQQKDDFISIASHELKTPITTLKASLQLLDRIKDQPNPSMLPKLIEQANKSMSKVNVLIDDLLNASMANNGQLHITQQQFILADVITESCQDVRAAGIYKLMIKGDLTLKVHADPIRVEQIIINFVNNAIKYAPKSTEIFITLEQQGQMAKVTVTDKGNGIAANRLPYLFDRYYRIEDRDSQYNGLGLGLYICTEIVKKHNGQIGVDSELGKGSSFWFTIPLA